MCVIEMPLDAAPGSEAEDLLPPVNVDGAQGRWRRTRRGLRRRSLLRRGRGSRTPLGTAKHDRGCRGERQSPHCDPASREAVQLPSASRRADHAQRLQAKSRAWLGPPPASVRATGCWASRRREPPGAVGRRCTLTGSPIGGGRGGVPRSFRRGRRSRIARLEQYSLREWRGREWAELCERCRALRRKLRPLQLSPLEGGRGTSSLPPRTAATWAGVGGFIAARARNFLSS